MPPIQSSVMYDSWYECSRAAHQESMKMMSKLGYNVVNKDKIAMKYRCEEINSIQAAIILPHYCGIISYKEIKK